MADFNLFLRALDKVEGGYQDDKNDPSGNLNAKGENAGTHYGITPNVYQEYIGHVPTRQEMQEMPKEHAADIVRTMYWDAMVHGDNIDNQQIASNIADMTVNSGKAGIMLAYERLWLNGYQVDPPASNQELSLQATDIFNAMDATQQGHFNNAYSISRLDYYNSLAGDSHHPTNAANLHGWTNRVIDHYPVDKDLAGWNEAKEANYYFTTPNIQYIINGEDWQHADGRVGASTQHALQAWQESHQLNPTGYIDKDTRELLMSHIMATEVTHAMGDINMSRGDIQDLRMEKGFDYDKGLQNFLEKQHTDAFGTGTAPPDALKEPVSFEHGKWELTEPHHFSNASTPSVNVQGQADARPEASGEHSHPHDHPGEQQSASGVPVLQQDAMPHHHVNTGSGKPDTQEPIQFSNSQSAASHVQEQLVVHSSNEKVSDHHTDTGAVNAGHHSVDSGVHESHSAGASTSSAASAAHAVSDHGDTSGI